MILSVAGTQFFGSANTSSQCAKLNSRIKRKHGWSSRRSKASRTAASRVAPAAFSIPWRRRHSDSGDVTLIPDRRRRWRRRRQLQEDLSAEQALSAALLARAERAEAEVAANTAAQSERGPDPGRARGESSRRLGSRRADRPGWPDSVLRASSVDVAGAAAAAAAAGDEPVAGIGGGGGGAAALLLRPERRRAAAAAAAAAAVAMGANSGERCSNDVD
jgi:hypothetical protein